jgi:hypothetical protein
MDARIKPAHDDGEVAIQYNESGGYAASIPSAFM